MLNDDLDVLYHIILKWDYFKDLREEELFINHLEEDITWENLRDPTKKYKDLENIQITFSSTEDYIKNFFSLFLIEVRAQLARNKYNEKEETEIFSLQLVSNNIKRKFFDFELLRENSKGVNYNNGDLILIHRETLDNELSNEHTLSIIDKFSRNIILSRVELDMNIPRCNSIAKYLSKNSKWYVTKLCNTATITREFSALMSIEDLLLKDILLNPLEDDYDDNNIKKKEDMYFYIPKKLDILLYQKFNLSQYEAIKNSIKKKGLTLIQGPPGTGKSTTILGILSVLLSSSLQKEEVDRKNSVIMQISNEMKLAKEKNNNHNINNDNNNDYYSLEDKFNYIIDTHPWYINDNNINDNIDFEIDDMFNFKEYPEDNKKMMIKPELSDISPPKKILICAPSNVAIDEIIRKLINQGLYDSNGKKYIPKLIRIGPNYNPNLKEYSLDYMINEFVKSNKNDNLNIKDNETIKNQILQNVKIICSTLSMTGSNILLNLNEKFDTIIIDEASQAIELSTLIPLKYNCERLILLGDPNQLNATVFSSIALKYNYDQSLFVRFQKAGHKILMLKTQYRMKAEVSNFISEIFYNNLVKNDESVYKIPKEIILDCKEFQPMTFYHIESEEKLINNSFYNEMQITIIIELIKKIINVYNNDIKVILSKVAILSPYSKQVNEINNILKKIIIDNNGNTIEVNTIDGFQGKEKSIIIFSTVRSLGSKTIGFLSDERRINVGLSRAKNCLIIIGDCKCLMKDPIWDKLIRYSFRKGTFYKIQGDVHKFFLNFNNNINKFWARNEKEFTKLIYEHATGNEI
jgi:senataxin